MWRTTENSSFYFCWSIISIHVPRVEDDGYFALAVGFEEISIHVPRVEDDPDENLRHELGEKFQSTSPVWRTTKYCPNCGAIMDISIHVPRVEDDGDKQPHGHHYIYFNPRPPCGGRPTRPIAIAIANIFQSTSPVWRTTEDDYCPQSFVAISIHVPRVEDDSPATVLQNRSRNFNPRPPCGGRLRGFTSGGWVCRLFQSTSPVWRTTVSKHIANALTAFQSTSPVWRTTVHRVLYSSKGHDFNPRPPCGGRLNHKSKE